MNGAVHLAEVLRIKTCLLELPIDIAGKNETALRHPRRHSMQHGKPGMRNRLPVKRQPMPVKPPGKMRITAEVVGAGDFLERNSDTAKGRISTPETLRATEIRQPGSHAHAGSGRNQQAISLIDQRCSFRQYCLLRGWIENCCQLYASPYRYRTRGRQSTVTPTKEVIMSTSQKTTNSLGAYMPTPLFAWCSGFEYVFGYQLKMVREFWGLAEEEN